MWHSYGSKGKAIIKATLLWLYPPETTPTDGFAPFRTEPFLEYFGVRYVGATLIQQDLDVDMNNACEIASISVPHGTSIHPEEDDDDELDSIMHRIMRGIREDRQAREKMEDAAV
jgi:hypothetical protein